MSRKNQIGTASTDVQVNGIRFAFYGRTSTTRHQDRVSSHGWQRDMADELVAGHGQVVAAYFDAGTSRRVPWRQRTQAAQLMTAASSPESVIDAIVIGEYERAFTGTQFATLYTWCTRHGLQLWLPETGGPVDLGNRDHRALMALLATQSQREVLRARHRVLAAMHNQATQQGRYLGGRPPYGYQLVDAGPHPNPADARWGRRLQRLAPDPRTAPHVAWMFRQRLAGHSVASIARHLNERGVPCPSIADPGRNRHRTCGAWTLRTVDFGKLNWFWPTFRDRLDPLQRPGDGSVIMLDRGLIMVWTCCFRIWRVSWSSGSSRSVRRCGCGRSLVLLRRPARAAVRCRGGCIPGMSAGSPTRRWPVGGW
jgi:DNA invertase Pin-like site-specific DNA recombinase